MRILGSAVLAMEIFIMGFAMLLGRKTQDLLSLSYGFGFMVLVILCIGLLKKRSGWIFGTLLQFALLGYAAFVPSMAIISLIFWGLWVAAIVVGRKGEAARAALMASRPPDA